MVNGGKILGGEDVFLPIEKRRKLSLKKCIQKLVVPPLVAGFIAFSGISTVKDISKQYAALKSQRAYAYSSESAINKNNSEENRINGLEGIVGSENATGNSDGYVMPSYDDRINQAADAVSEKIPENKLDAYINNYGKMHMDEKYRPLVEKLSAKYEMDSSKLAAIIEVESNWNVKSESSCGAASLMQITENSSTAQEWKNRYNPETNISAGIRIWNAKENALSFAAPPESLKQENPTLYWKANWEHFKIVAAAYNGGQSPIIDALEMAKEKNGKEYWAQEWADIAPLMVKACDPYYNAYKEKAEEIIYYVKKITDAYTLYSAHFEIEKIAEKTGDIETAEIIREIKNR